MTWLDGLVAVSPILAIVAAGLYRMHLDHKETIKELQRRLNVAQECIRTLLAEQSKLRSLQAENEDFRATIDYLTRENAEQIGEIVALKEQRDELLEALKDYDDAFTGFDPSSKESRHRMRQAVIKARAAIVKAGGAA